MFEKGTADQSSSGRAGVPLPVRMIASAFVFWMRRVPTGPEPPSGGLGFGCLGEVSELLSLGFLPYQ